jgi:thymidylate synthase (FAD)
MDKIEVKILDHNFNGMARFLARLTQRGHEISCMNDLLKIYKETVHTPPSAMLLTLPHTTIKRMNYMTVAITGLSTKAVSQIRTHATRLTFVSTSTQYSSYEGRKDNYTIPDGLSEDERHLMNIAFSEVQERYNQLIHSGLDKDKVGYLLPQGLRKALIISGNMDAWQYVLSLRLCHRNTLETQHIMKLIYKEIEKEAGVEYTVGMLPPCAQDQYLCKEGKFCCGKKFSKEELL